MIDKGTPDEEKVVDIDNGVMSKIRERKWHCGWLDRLIPIGEVGGDLNSNVNMARKNLCG